MVSYTIHINLEECSFYSERLGFFVWSLMPFSTLFQLSYIRVAGASVHPFLNPLPNNENLYLSKLKSITGSKINVESKTEICF